MLTHEYVHFLMYEISGGEVLPAWLNEGLAEYFEFEVGLLGKRPQATVWRMLRSADRARDAAEAGNLFPLSELESQRDWNSRPGGERVSLQYSQSHMLVRYITESYGAAAPLRMVERIGDGETVASAVRAIASVEYPQLEQDFVTWLVRWDEPVRAESRPYIQTLDELLAARPTISDPPEELIKEWNLSFDRAASKAAMEPLVQEMDGLIQRLEEASAPESLSDLHEAALTYLGAYQEFINEDLKFFSTGSAVQPGQRPGIALNLENLGHRSPEPAKRRQIRSEPVSNRTPETTSSPRPLHHSRLVVLNLLAWPAGLLTCWNEAGHFVPTEMLGYNQPQPEPSRCGIVRSAARHDTQTGPKALVGGQR